MLHLPRSTALRSLLRTAVLGSALLFVTAHLAAQITLSGELDTPDSSYSYESGGSGSNGSSASLAASVLPSFTYEFSSAGDTVVTATWTAPTGKMIVIDTPDGWDNAGIQLEFKGGARTGNAYYEAHSVQGVTSFSDLTGSFTSGGSATLIFAETNYYEVSSYLNIASGGRVTFTSASVTYTVPGSLDHDYSHIAATVIDIIGNVSVSGSQEADPGTWIHLEDAPSAGGSAVPEPSTYALFLGAAMLGFVAWRRRV